jgi:ABC-type lipoprotein release transport system permease subunit
MKSRYKNLLNYSLNCIQRYKVRTLVVLICLVIAASLFSSVAFIEDSLKKDGELSLKYSPDLTVQGIESGRQTYINTSYISIIQKISGVREVSQRIWGYGNIGNTLIVIVGVDLTSTTVNPAAPYPLEEGGSFLDAQKNNTVVIGKAVAKLLGAEVGETLSILSESNQIRQYTIAGIFNSESSIYSADMILMNLNDARTFFRVPNGKVTDLIVYVNKVDSSRYESFVNFVARGVSELSNVRVLTKDILLKAQESTFGNRAGFFSLVWYIILIAVALIAFNQTVVVGHESKFEVGLLKALGFSTSDVIQIRLLESAILGTIAGSIGLTVGILYDAVLNAPVLREFMLGWANLYPSFSLPVYISAQTVLITYAITIVPLLFATVIPSWLNATVDPDIAMRGAKA